MKTLHAGNITLLNQQCAEGNKTIKEKTQSIHPQVLCDNCSLILFYKVCLSWRINSGRIRQEALRENNKIFSRDHWKNLWTVKYILGGSSACRYFSPVKSAETQVCCVHEQTTNTKFEGDGLLAFFVSRIKETCTPVRDLLAQNRDGARSKLWISFTR